MVGSELSLDDGQGAIQDRARGIELTHVARAAANLAQQADSTTQHSAKVLGVSGRLQHMRQQPTRAGVRQLDLYGHR